jgi:hypothetical protein
VLDIFHNLVQLVTTMLTLIVEIGGLALRHLLLIAWIAWWLWGVRWTTAWRVLAKGGWAVVLLLTVLAALAWASLAPSACDVSGVISIGNFWWQLGVVALLVLSALFCGWLQGVFGWEPAEVILAPATQDHGHAEHHAH